MKQQANTTVKRGGYRKTRAERTLKILKGVRSVIEENPSLWCRLNIGGVALACDLEPYDRVMAIDAIRDTITSETELRYWTILGWEVNECADHCQALAMIDQTIQNVEQGRMAEIRSNIPDVLKPFSSKSLSAKATSIISELARAA